MPRRLLLPPFFILAFEFWCAFFKGFSPMTPFGFPLGLRLLGFFVRRFLPRPDASFDFAPNSFSIALFQLIFLLRTFRWNHKVVSKFIFRMYFDRRSSRSHFVLMTASKLVFNSFVLIFNLSFYFFFLVILRFLILI